MKNNQIVIVCSGNKTFIIPLKVTLKSAVINTKSTIEAFIFFSDWDEEDICLFKRTFAKDNISIHFIKVKEYPCFKDFKTEDNITIESYFRIFIPELIPLNVDQIIYLDGDIVVEGDILELWNIPMRENIIMAVPEMNKIGYYVSDSYALKTYKILNIPQKNKYFNAGVLKINVRKWRENNISEQIVNYLIKYKKEILWHDQDGLNAILWNNWDELPCEWNVMTALYWEKNYNCIGLTFDKAIYVMKHPKIIHYTTSNKPWKEDCTHPLKERYHYYKRFL